MREIKFRAWDEEANIMVYSDHRTRKLYDVYYGFEVNEQGELECRWEGEWNESQRLDGGTLDNIEQYTGLKDKNGVEIYEGDILKAGDGYTGLIGYRTESAQFVGFNIGNEFTEEKFDTLYTVNGSFNSAEVIGNRFETPELLKEEPTC